MNVWRINRALLWKEWREQRWRGVLSVLVLTTLSASLVRAQLVSLPEAVLLLFGPVGLLLAIFLAMGSVATERQDGTWDFLRAQPAGPASILRTKWLVGAVQLAVAFLIAGLAAHLAAWSRGLYDLPPPPGVAGGPGWGLGLGNSAEALWRFVMTALVSMLAWYTVLFFILTRARNELHAGLGGLLLTIVALAWLLQYVFARTLREEYNAVLTTVFWGGSVLNPLSPLPFLLGESWPATLLAPGLALLLWLIATLWLVGWLERAGRLR